MTQVKTSARTDSLPKGRDQPGAPAKRAAVAGFCSGQASNNPESTQVSPGMSLGWNRFPGTAVIRLDAITRQTLRFREPNHDINHRAIISQAQWWASSFDVVEDVRAPVYRGQVRSYRQR